MLTKSDRIEFLPRCDLIFTAAAASARVGGGSLPDARALPTTQNFFNEQFNDNHNSNNSDDDNNNNNVILSNQIERGRGRIFDFNVVQPAKWKV